MDFLKILVAESGPLEGAQFLLEEGAETMVGRSEDCAICIPDANVSRKHAKIGLDGMLTKVYDKQFAQRHFR